MMTEQQWKRARGAVQSSDGKAALDLLGELLGELAEGKHDGDVVDPKLEADAARQLTKSELAACRAQKCRPSDFLALKASLARPIRPYASGERGAFSDSGRFTGGKR
ncbi:MAG TPA: hypothetical protein VE987_15940 [Polyangiaceae bacterium]|nr:hypothetical protein [Polyangiaceae bacterium]